MDDVLAAARAFVGLSNEEDEMFVVNFNEHVTMGLTGGLPGGVVFSNRSEEMEAAILRAPVTGQTALYDALNVSLDRLRTGHHAKKVLIVISDGGDNASKATLPQMLKKSEESNAILYTIGIFDPNDPDQDVDVLRRLAKETGGESWFPEQSREAVSICQDIARDIRRQYTVGYVSSSKKVGGRRSVKVIARSRGKDLVVRTRPEYTAEETQARGGAGK